jgi:hypothetical protein
MAGFIKDAIWIVGVLLAVGAAIWLYLRVALVLEQRFDRVFGQSWRSLRGPRHEPTKVEIQTLFHRNTKDQDQI